MSYILAQLITWLNLAADGMGRWLLAPIAWLPGWLSATLAAIATGVLALAAFKYTSNQRAIQQVRDEINANLLTLKLFKNDVRVAMKAQGDLLSGAIQLLKYALVPLLVMMLPATLIYAQLSQWFQQRPLKVGEKTVLTMKLNGDRGGSFPDVGLKRTDAVKTLVGPVRIFSKRQVCWTIEASEKGYHLLVLNVNDQTIEKELAVGDGFMRVSTERSEWSDALLHPGERPFGPDSPVRSIEVDYPERSSWTSGTNYWVIYWFIVSMVAAFCFRRVLKVNV